MTPEQMKKKRLKAGLSQAQLAIEVNNTILKPGKYKTIGTTAIANMEQGINPVSWYVRKYFEDNAF